MAEAEKASADDGSTWTAMGEAKSEWPAEDAADGAQAVVVETKANGVGGGNEEAKPAPSLTRKTRMHSPMAKGQKTQLAQPIIMKDRMNRIEIEHIHEAWQYYLRRRPLQDEIRGVPLGFCTETDRDGSTNVVLKGKDQAPQTNWASLAKVDMEDFTSLGPGLVMTFRFMMFTGIFFLAFFMGNIPAMALQGFDPTDQKWLGTAMYGDIVFMFVFAVFMVYLRYDAAKVGVQVEKDSITTNCFSIMVENVPIDATADELAEYFAQFGELYHDPDPKANLFDNDFDRTGVSMTYNNSDMIDIGFDLIESIETRKSCNPDTVDTTPTCCGMSTGMSLVAREEELIAKLDELRSKSYEVSGPCFVVFEQASSRDACLVAFGNRVQIETKNKKDRRTDVEMSVSGSRKGKAADEEEDAEDNELLGGFPRRRQTATGATLSAVSQIYKIFQKVEKCSETAKPFRGEVHLEVSPAPDPTDIIWTNIGVPKQEVTIRRVIAWSISFIYIIFLITIIITLCGLNRWSVETGEVGLLEFLPGILTVGNAATLGAAALLATNVLFVQPFITLFEKLPTRTKLEKITFVKCSVFQAGTVFIAAIVVFGISSVESSLTALATDLIELKLPWGTGLPSLKDCSRRFDADEKITLAMPSGRGFDELDKGSTVYPHYLDEKSCLAYTTHIFGSGISAFLTSQLAADVVFINTIDLVCPNWWVNTMVASKQKYYQRDLNILYEGVDFHPYLRYQVLMKFMFIGLVMPPVEFPRVMYFWTAACFFQCYYIERYCFVKRYRHQPVYNMSFIHVLIFQCLPAGLIMHIGSSVFMFCFTYSRDKGGQNILEITPNVSTLVPFIIFYGLLIFFLIGWYMPLKVWANFRRGDTFSHGTDLRRIIAADPILSRDIDADSLNMKYDKLSYSEALNATKDHHLGKVNLLNGVSVIEVHKYVPFPKRREFGVALQIRG
jgi:hypothetical protein